MKNFLKYTLASLLGTLVALILILVISLGIISIIVSTADKEVTVKENSVLTIKLDTPIAERGCKNPFSDLGLPGLESIQQVGLNQILDCINKAKTDENIKGIYLNLTVIQSGMATIEQIRNALFDFKKSGKFIYAYSDAMTQPAYYLSTAADSIFINPAGTLDFRGLNSERAFYKKALDKIGVDMQIIRHGKYKSAVEPYMQDKMSPANREQVEAYINGLWSHMLNKISEKRKIPVNRLDSLADRVLTFQGPEVAAKAKLIDGVKYKDQILDDLRKLTGTQKGNDIASVNVAEYSKTPAKTDGKGLAKEKIAVIYAVGEIDMGGSGNNSIDSEVMAREIRKAREDASIKAIVLRINSPGGSALGSEIMWREVNLAKKVKPVIASFGDVAASGGYYMACPANVIVAQPNTITGSIGIFGMIPNAKKLLEDKLGITYDRAMTNKHSDMPSLTRALSPEERILIQSYIERGYATFVNHVSEGRRLTFAHVDSIGQGRVWTGAMAKQIGLVDELGGIDKAIAIAAKKAKLDRYRIVDLPEIKDPFQELLKGISNDVKAKILHAQLGEAYEQYTFIHNASTHFGIMARMPYDEKIY
ncbi:MAG: signal peptide peptidase SppA [Bacteroidota bacterium]|nr:signal peptide peptidase SppA [Bacteroidota bacterium]MDP4205138.1 signal peptide peptidase SppA [Bacteroidota bacterium]